MKNLKQILLLLALTFNLLIPVHSDWFFGSLSDGNTQIISPFSRLVSSIFFNFGEIGVGMLEIMHFSLISLLIYCFFIKNGLEKTNSQQALNLLVSLLLIGVVQYGQDMHPAQTFLELNLFFLLKLDQEIEAKLKFRRLIVEIIVLLLFVLIDWRNIFCPLIAALIISIKDRSKINLHSLGGMFFTIALLFIVPNLQNIFVLDILTYLNNFDLAFFKVDTFSSAFSYDFAFLLLLLSFFLILNFKEKSFSMKLCFILLLILFSMFSYRFKAVTGLVLTSFIVFEPLENLKGQMVIKLRVALEKLYNLSSEISSEGLVFLFSSMIFVSIVSFLKLPITEKIFPLASINQMIEQGRCPDSYSPELTGYLQFRFAHDASCLALMKRINLTNTTFDPKKLSIEEYIRLPDRFRK